MDRYQIVADEKILKDFLVALGCNELSKLESYLVVTSFRSKKLNDEERKKLGARNREMYLTKNLKVDRKGVFDLEAAVNKIYELEVPIRALTYNIGTPDEISLPQKAMVCYICPNPSKEVDVAIEHMESTLDIVKNYIHASDKGDSANQLAHHNTDFRSERSKLLNRKWVDFDIDIECSKDNRYSVKNIIKVVIDNSPELKNPKCLIVETAGGFHVLVKKDCLKGNPRNICESFIRNFEGWGKVKEVDYKAEGYLPLVGTYQYSEHIVTFEKYGDWDD